MPREGLHPILDSMGACLGAGGMLRANQVHPNAKRRLWEYGFAGSDLSNLPPLLDSMDAHFGACRVLSAEHLHANAKQRVRGDGHATGDLPRQGLHPILDGMGADFATCQLLCAKHLHANADQWLRGFGDPREALPAAGVRYRALAAGHRQDLRHGDGDPNEDSLGWLPAGNEDQSDGIGDHALPGLHHVRRCCLRTKLHPDRMHAHAGWAMPRRLHLQHDGGNAWTERGWVRSARLAVVIKCCGPAALKCRHSTSEAD